MASVFPAARLGRDQAVTLAGLAGVTVLAWAYVFRDAAHMASMEMGAGGMDGTMGPAHPFDPVSLALMFLMWSVMMVAMMLPSAAPAILIYAKIAGKRTGSASPAGSAWLFTLGYLAMWTAFSALATALQSGLQQAALLSPMLVSKSGWLSGALLVVAGIYQWLPIKEACLRKCRAPLQFFMFHWRPGNAGALRMGVEHGGFCLGCCWALMLLLFVAGVMNLLWVALIAVFVLLEKLAPNGALAGRISGIAMAVLGGGLMAGIWSF